MGFTFIKHTTAIDFIGKRGISYAVSVLFIVAGLLTVAFGGLKMGIDFAGGVIMQIQFSQPVADETLKQSLTTPSLPGLSTQRYGEGGRDYLLRFSSADSDATQLRNAVTETLTAAFPENPVTIQRLEMVGPKVGTDLTNKALEAFYYATLLIAVYISGRFEQRWMAGGIMAAALWGGMYLLGMTGLGTGTLVCISLALVLAVCWKLHLNFALGAVVGLLHDVLVTVGLLAMLGYEIDLNIVAAILTLVGYSLNDTIIIYDRIRENFRVMKDASLKDIINNSVNQTLSRTILTGGTTLLATLSLFCLGGDTIHGFSLTMLIGIIVGTFSSIYVSSAILLDMRGTAQGIKDVEPYERPGEHGVV